MSIKIKTQLALIGFFLLLAISLLLSQKATPDFSPLFSLKRGQEKFFLSLKNDPKGRLDYERGLLNTRLEELESQVKRQSYSNILPSASRYSTLAGEITDQVLANSFLKDQSGPIKEQFNNHLKALNEIYVLYPKNTDNTEYKYIEDDINYLKIYIEKLSK